MKLFVKHTQMLFIANTYFEFELEGSSSQDLLSSLKKNPIFLQLQFLPLLWGEQTDLVGIIGSPHNSYYKQLENTFQGPLSTIVSLSNPEIFSPPLLSPWGHSPQISQWAKKHNLPYIRPSWETLRQVNSKAFSFLHSPPLKGAQLLYNQKEVESWVTKRKKDSVLKSCFGVAAKGNLLIRSKQDLNKKNIQSFLQKQWKQNLPVIAEPWVRKTLDFSTQWFLSQDKDVQYLGATFLQNNTQGQYQTTIVQPNLSFPLKKVWALKEHKTHAKIVLEKMIQLGYFGHVGIDAMLYHSEEQDRELLHPVVEINARKTMSYAALMLQRTKFPNQSISLSYSSSSNKKIPLLPQSFTKPDGSSLSFSHQLYLKF